MAIIYYTKANGVVVQANRQYELVDATKSLEMISGIGVIDFCGMKTGK